MKILLLTVAGLALLVVGFAVGYPVGKAVGFSDGSEWAMIQAELVARESGMFMPVRLEDGMFRVKYEQPANLHRRAWKAADRYEDFAIGANCDVRLIGRGKPQRSAYNVQ